MALRPEEIDHINVVNWFHHNYPEFADDFHHFANERHLDVKRNPGLWNAARKLTRMGVKKGVADFFLAIGCGGRFGLWLELKVGNGKLSPEQETFLRIKNDRGYVAVAVWGADAAKEVIKSYLLGGLTFFV